MPSTASSAGPADARFEQLITQHFRETLERSPVLGTYLGLSEYDDLLSDGTREALEQRIGAARRYRAELEAIQPGELSPANRIERELALFGVRRQLFDDEVQRSWERRTTAADELGDGVFLLLQRGSRPMTQRLLSIASRLESADRLIEQQQDRLGETPVRLWSELELRAAGSLPTLFEEILAVARAEFAEGSPELTRLERATAQASAALDGYSAWLKLQLARATDDFALGHEPYDELISLRAFDGLTADDILEIGQQQLADNRAARRAVAAEIDSTASEAEVLDRVKSDHPADFESALQAYRDAMAQARQFVDQRGIASLPEGEALEVVPTPGYLRRSLPFAAYFGPAKFDPGSKGIYVVTPSVDGDARALREHNYASIYNTSIHEAYPGHHQQLTAANQHPSLVRQLIDAPEFVEGWAMYCEQMMREEGFDNRPERRLMMYTDAIWRACRIILDVRLHRGEIGLAEAIDFLVDQTGFERPNATAEVQRYTHTPTYQLSYLLGKVLLMRLRDDEKRRLGAGFSLRRFHDALLREGSLPISFQRRLLQDGLESANE